MLRSKMMTTDEWADFEIKVADIVMGGKDFRYALFREAGALADPGRILIAGPAPDVIEALSPGGWDDHPGAKNGKWIHLVGDRAVAEEYGISLGI